MLVHFGNSSLHRRDSQNEIFLCRRWELSLNLVSEQSWFCYLENGGMLGLKLIRWHCWPGSLTPSKNLRFWFIKTVKTHSIYTRKWISKIWDTHCHLTETQNYFYIVFTIMYYSYWLWQHTVRALWSGIELALIYWILIILCKYCCTVPFPMGWRQTLLISQGVIKIIRLRSLNVLHLFLFAAAYTHTLAWQPINSVALGKELLSAQMDIKALVSLIYFNVKNTLKLMLNNFINCFYGFYVVFHLTTLLQWLHIMECSSQWGLMCTPRASLYLNSVHWHFILKAPSWRGAPQCYTDSSVNTWERK